MNLEGTKVKLEYLTHDARGVLKAIDRDDLNIYWQVRLIELCYNYNVVTVLRIIKDQFKRNPDLPTYHNIRAAVPFIQHNKQHAKAVFTDEAIVSLYMIDRAIIVTDYNTRIEALADVLNKISKDEISIIVGENDRCNMGLLLTKMEEFVGDREKQWKEIRRDTKFDLPARIHTSAAAQDKLEALLADIKSLKEV